MSDRESKSVDDSSEQVEVRRQKLAKLKEEMDPEKLSKPNGKVWNSFMNYGPF